MNIHSTQGIESVHGAVANILTANMMLTVLLPKLEAYNAAAVSSHAETRMFRQTRLFQLQYKGHHRLIEEARLPAAALLCGQAPCHWLCGARTSPPRH